MPCVSSVAAATAVTPPAIESSPPLRTSMLLLKQRGKGAWSDLAPHTQTKHETGAIEHGSRTSVHKKALEPALRREKKNPDRFAARLVSMCTFTAHYTAGLPPHCHGIMKCLGVTEPPLSSRRARISCHNSTALGYFYSFGSP